MFFDFSNFLITNTKSNSFSGNGNCRMAAYFSQQGHCFVTGRELVSGHRELHHRLPRKDGGTDIPINTILLDKRVHRLVHATHPEEIQWLLDKLDLTRKELRHVNQLRLEAGEKHIEEVLAASPTNVH